MTTRQTHRIYTHALPGGSGELVCAGPADPDGAVRAARAVGDAHPGFWANLWPAARALADWCATTLFLPDAGLIVEVGCGLALPSLACARRGCRVLATDQDERAGPFVERSATMNGLDERVAFSPIDIAQPGAAAAMVSALGDAPDAIVAADVLYDEALHDALVSVCDELACLSAIASPKRDGSDAAETALTEQGFRSHRLAPNVRLLLRGGSAV
jgi:predicted nicotinamide N-methyase